jgi:hypothetical protein
MDAGNDRPAIAPDEVRLELQEAEQRDDAGRLAALEDVYRRLESELDRDVEPGSP